MRLEDADFPSRRREQARAREASDAAPNHNNVELFDGRGAQPGPRRRARQAKGMRRRCDEREGQQLGSPSTHGFLQL